MNKYIKIFAALLSAAALIALTFAAPLAACGVTYSDIPENASETELLWQYKFSDTFFQAPSVPGIRGDDLFVMTGSTLARLDRFTGRTEASAELAGRCTFTTVPVSFAGDLAICPMDDGTVQAFDADTMAEKWLYKNPRGGQCLTEAVICEGYVFTGFWNGDSDDADYVCLDAATGKEVWTRTHKGGFYGDVACIACGCLVIGCENGDPDDSSPSQILCLDPLTGEVLSTMAVMGDIRSGVTFDEETGRFFVVSKAKYMYSFEVKDGVIRNSKTLLLPGASTGVPTVYNGRVYVGTQGAFVTKGKIAVIGAGTTQIIYTVSTPGYCQSRLVVKPHFDDPDTVTVYGAYNYPPGGIICFDDSPGATAAETRELFRPEAAQYCISPLVIADSGEIYYKNDSCIVFALKKPGAAVNPVFLKLRAFFNRLMELLNHAGFRR